MAKLLNRDQKQIIAQIIKEFYIKLYSNHIPHQTQLITNVGSEEVPQEIRVNLNKFKMMIRFLKLWKNIYKFSLISAWMRV